MLAVDTSHSVSARTDVVSKHSQPSSYYKQIQIEKTWVANCTWNCVLTLTSKLAEASSGGAWHTQLMTEGFRLTAKPVRRAPQRMMMWGRGMRASIPCLRTASSGKQRKQILNPRRKAIEGAKTGRDASALLPLSLLCNHMPFSPPKKHAFEPPQKNSGYTVQLPGICIMLLYEFFYCQRFLDWFSGYFHIMDPFVFRETTDYFLQKINLFIRSPHQTV
jgi:hypothetical protein